MNISNGKKNVSKPKRGRPRKVRVKKAFPLSQYMHGDKDMKARMRPVFEEAMEGKHGEGAAVVIAGATCAGVLDEGVTCPIVQDSFDGGIGACRFFTGALKRLKENPTEAVKDMAKFFEAKRDQILNKMRYGN